MTDERKSSEDLIREARERLRGEPGDAFELESDENDHESARPGGNYARSLEEAVPTDPLPREARGSVPTLADQELDAHSGDTWEDGRVLDQPRPWYTGRWVRWVAILAIGLGYGLFTSLDDADRDATGEIVGVGDLDVMSIREGDCFDDPASDDEVVFDVAAVPCSQPHDNEVFAVESIAGVFGSGYPGRSALEEHGYQLCSGPLFDSYVGVPYLQSELDVFTLTPTDDSWEQGDREVVCVLYRLDFGKLTGSARDSGL